jgi:hypothetical protein
MERCEKHLLPPIQFPKVMMITVFFFLIALWSWFGRGPYFLRWPAVLAVIVFTSGHPLAALLGKDLEPLAGPLLTLFFMILGLTIMLRALFGTSRRRRHYDDEPPGYGHGLHHRYSRRYGRRYWDEW